MRFEEGVQPRPQVRIQRCYACSLLCGGSLTLKPAQMEPPAFCCPQQKHADVSAGFMPWRGGFRTTTPIPMRTVRRVQPGVVCCVRLCHATLQLRTTRHEAQTRRSGVSVLWGGDAQGGWVPTGEMWALWVVVGLGHGQHHIPAAEALPPGVYAQRTFVLDWVQYMLDCDLSPSPVGHATCHDRCDTVLRRRGAVSRPQVRVLALCLGGAVCCRGGGHSASCQRLRKCVNGRGPSRRFAAYDRFPAEPWHMWMRHSYRRILCGFGGSSRFC